MYTENEKEEAVAIGQALRVAIPLARALGWTSEHAYREAEEYAHGRRRAMMASCQRSEASRSSGGPAAAWPTESSRMARASP
jgi:hypothetical protein